jgi:hypothetical protein
MRHSLEINYFGLFFYLVTANTYALFASFNLLLNGGVEHVFGDGMEDTIPACLESVLGQREASQLRVPSWEEKKVCRGDFRQIEGGGLS